MSRQLRFTLFICAIIFAFGNINAQNGTDAESKALDEITVADAKTHMNYLASKELKGREAGSAEGKKAAEYIAKLFKSWNITPAGDKDTHLQLVPGLGTPKFDEKKNYFKIWTAGVDLDDPTTVECKMETEYAPMGYVNDAEIDTTLVFAGYGISAPEVKYNDYENIDVKNKIVIMFRYAPKYGKEDTKFQGASYNHAYFHAKLANARRHGAKAVLMINPPGTDKELMSPGRSGFAHSNNIPLIQITEEIGNKLLEGTGETVKSVFDEINKNNKPKSFEIKFRKVQLKIKSTRSSGQNVIGKIEGSDEKLKKEIIVVGAHYDHIGMGYFGSRMGIAGKDKIHFGADDNASGTVGVMEIAKAFSKLKQMTKRTVVFALWDGEEKGLVGSSYFVENPTVNLENVVAYINFDMIGRLREDKLNALGVSSSKAWDGILKEINEEYNFDLKSGGSPYGGSDQASFARHKIPVVFFITGGHEDYHTPNDSADKINYEGLVKVSKYTYKLIETLANADEKLVTWTMN